MLKWEVRWRAFSTIWLRRDLRHECDLGTRSFQFLDRAGMSFPSGTMNTGRATSGHRRAGGRTKAFTWLLLGEHRLLENQIRGPERPGSPRTVVCYKQNDDPLGSHCERIVPGRWIKKPENALLGVCTRTPIAYISLRRRRHLRVAVSGLGSKPAIRFQDGRV